MKVKRYIAEDAQQAMLKVKTELGLNAIILNSRKIKRPGILGIFRKPLIEMVAAIDEELEKSKNKEQSSLPSEKMLITKDREIDKMDQLKEQVDNIEYLLDHLVNKVEILPEQYQEKESILFKKYHSLLLENDIENSISNRIMQIVKKQVNFIDENEEAIKKAIKIIIKEYLGSPSLINAQEKEQKKIAFIGPTGVGKTTTIAKIAAKMSIHYKKSVGLITSDTYRIAAVEQLKTYGEILDVPVHVIYDPGEIQEAIASYQDKDVILIDTAGRNHQIKNQLQETKTMISSISDLEVFVVLSAATGYREIVSIINAYDFLKDYKLLFTKLDECTAVGNILNTKVLTGKQLSYFTTGQSVPDDIEIANPDKIADKIVGE